MKKTYIPIVQQLNLLTMNYEYYCPYCNTWVNTEMKEHLNQNHLDVFNGGG